MGGDAKFPTPQPRRIDLAYVECKMALWAFISGLFGGGASLGVTAVQIYFYGYSSDSPWAAIFAQPPAFFVVIGLPLFVTMTLCIGAHGQIRESKGKLHGKRLLALGAGLALIWAFVDVIYIASHIMPA